MFTGRERAFFDAKIINVRLPLGLGALALSAPAPLSTPQPSTMYGLIGLDRRPREKTFLVTVRYRTLPYPTVGYRGLPLSEPLRAVRGRILAVPPPVPEASSDSR
jgi:hypothetical protein